MKKNLFPIVLLFVLAVLIPNSVGFASRHSTPVFSNNLQDTDGSFTFTQLKEGELRMIGPYATETMFFGLPANWKITSNPQLELDYSVTVQTKNSTANGQFYGGSLTVFINNQIVSSIPLNESGRFNQTLSIPVEFFESTRRDGRQELSIVLSSGESCLYDTRIEVVVYSDSRFVIPHELTAPDTDLRHFPRPLYQDSIFVDSVLIIVPDQPTSAELQAAISVSAGMEARTAGGLDINVVNHSSATEDKLAASHLVFIGKASSLPLLYQLATPMELKNGSFSDADNAGVLQMIPSPWSPERVVLIVSGNTDEATVKAAQALSTGVIRPADSTNVALIDSVNNRVYFNESSVDQTLEGMGYESVTFEGRGENTETFQFYIPAGQTVTPEAYFEASISNSTLLNYARSGVFVFLNNQPIGSIRLSDDTANKSNNRIQIAIPPSAVRSGLNLLDVSVALEPLDECADPNQTGLFVTLWADSRLYLPLATKSVNTVEIPDLSTYPAPFIQSPDLGNVAFILQKDNPEAWASAVRVAGYLGSQSDGVIFTPAAFYADEVGAVDLSKYNIMAFGLPSKMEFINQINNNLPVPFDPGSDIASEKELQVVYQVDPQQPAGYLQLLSSPWNVANLIIAVVGNNPQGVSWSADTLLSESSRQTLLGNFAVIRGEQVLSVDTRFLEIEAPVDLGSEISTPSIAEETPIASSPVRSVTSWIPFALGISLVLMILVIVVTLGVIRKKNE